MVLTVYKSIIDLSKINKELVLENISIKSLLKKKNKDIEILSRKIQLVNSQNKMLIEKQENIDMSNFLHLPLEEYYFLETKQYKSKIFLLEQGKDFIMYNIKNSKKNFVLSKLEIIQIIQI